MSRTAPKNVHIDNARTTDQAEVLKLIQKGKFCPFCDPNYLKNEHKKPILKNGKFWIATENRWPYEGAKVHLIFIHKKHIASIEQLKPEAWQELRQIVVSLKKKNNIPGGTLMMRFGDMRCTGGTVEHLHAQLVSGDASNPDRKPVVVRVG